MNLFKLQNRWKGSKKNLLTDKVTVTDNPELPPHTHIVESRPQRERKKRTVGIHRLRYWTITHRNKNLRRHTCWGKKLLRMAWTKRCCKHSYMLPYQLWKGLNLTSSSPLPLHSFGIAFAFFKQALQACWAADHLNFVFQCSQNIFCQLRLLWCSMWRALFSDECEYQCHNDNSEEPGRTTWLWFQVIIIVQMVVSLSDRGQSRGWFGRKPAGWIHWIILLVKRFWYATARSLSELPRELVYSGWMHWIIIY